MLVVISALHGDAWHIISTSVYGATPILLYTASTLYHGVSLAKAKLVLQRLDHAAVFILIAGSVQQLFLRAVLCGTAKPLTRAPRGSATWKPPLQESEC